MSAKEKQPADLTPSPSLAWIIGSISGRGIVNNRTGEICFGNRDENVEKEFIRLGEEVFDINIPYRSLRTFKGGEYIKYLTPSFFNISIARALGDLSRTQFPTTIQEKHDWILRDPANTLRYSEGLFEARGNIYKRAEGESKDIIFQTSFPEVSDFIADVLKKLGISPTIIKMRMGTELRTKGVTISTIPEQKKFADLVHSLDPEKEKQLEEIRNTSLEKAQTRIKSKDEVIEEWRKITEILGHIPNMNEINALFKDDKTKWSHEIYIYWFGEKGKTRNFSTARKQLVQITNPNLSQEQLELLTRRYQRRAEMSLLLARNLEKLKKFEERQIKLERERMIIQQKEAKRKRRQTEANLALQPSRELARVLGLLVSGGQNDLREGSMSYRSSSEFLQKAFIDLAGNLFRTNLTWQTRRSKKGEVYKMPQFNRVNIARGIGELKRSTWPITISERHSWIISDQNYTWAFLSSIFDDKGIFIGTDKKHLVIPTSFRQTANFITELLSNVGIQNPVILRRQAAREGVQGVAITNIRDLQRFAGNVRSVIPEKEKVLEEIRLDIFRKPRTQAPFDERKLAAEWKRLYDLLGHTPNVTDLAELYVEGKTPWSAGVYSRVFGKTGTTKGRSYEVALHKLVATCGMRIPTDGSIRYRRPEQKYKTIKNASDLIAQYRRLRQKTLSEKKRLPFSSDFDKARRSGLIDYSRVTFANHFGAGKLIDAIAKLEDLVSAQETNETLQEFYEQTGVQIRYVPKIHRFYDEKAVMELEEILARHSDLSVTSIFYGPHGEKLA